jgi:glutamine amidotransferase
MHWKKLFMIVIINSGTGNYGAIQNMFRKIGVETKLASTAKEILNADKLILPGVGAFDDGMSQLVQCGLVESLRHMVLDRHVPLLGICLGMQLLTEGSEEGCLPGLGFVSANVHGFDLSLKNLKVPHMGWNTLKVCKAGPLLDFSSEYEQRFYFVHSYRVTCHNRDDVLAMTEHGVEFVSAFQHNNIFGVQFHPEKSHRFGMGLLRRFAEV